MKQINIYRNRYLQVACICLLFFSACKKDDFLDVQNNSAVGSATAFATESSADLVLNDVYQNLPNGNGFNFDPFENFSDNSVCGFNWPFSANDGRRRASWTESTAPGGFGSEGNPFLWGDTYSKIRKCNVFIAGVQASSTLAQDYKDKRISEARVLRAFYEQ